MRAWCLPGLALAVGLVPRPASADASSHLFRFMGGPGLGLAPPYEGGTPAGVGVGAGGHVGGRALLQLGRLAGDFGVREGLYRADFRSVGALFFGARYTPASPWSARVGFAHHHEVADEVLFETPVGAVAGTAPGIRHRSGVEVGGGRHWVVSGPWEDGRVGVQLEGAAAWLADPRGPSVYGFVDLLLTVDAGPRLAR